MMELCSVKRRRGRRDREDHVPRLSGKGSRAMRSSREAFWSSFGRDRPGPIPERGERRCSLAEDILSVLRTGRSTAARGPEAQS